MSYLHHFSLLKRNRNFRFIYLGQFVSFIGNMITMVALPYQIYHETQSTIQVGLLGAFQLFPILFTALIGGVIADRYPRRQLLIFTEILLALGCLLLAVNSLTMKPSIIFIYGIAMLTAAVTGLHRPSLDSAAQQIVAKEDFPALGALAALKWSVSMVAGPALGGLLISCFGLVTTYLIDFSTFLFSLGMLFFVKLKPIVLQDKPESVWQSLKTGFSYALARQELIGTYVVDMVAMIVSMPTVLFPAIAQQLGGPKTLGLLYASTAIGALFISIFGNWTSKVKRHGVAIAIAASCWGISIIFFGIFRNYFLLSLFFLVLAGGFDAVSGIFRSVVWNERVPNHLRGRLAGIEMISYLTGPRLGDTLMGFSASFLGVTFSIVSGGLLCVMGVGICCYNLPRFWKYRSSINE